MSNAFVVALGMGTVFVGLICIIIICKIVGAICMAADKKKGIQPEKTDNTAVAAPAVIENRQEIIAAVSAVVAEELGKDISAIRILSFKKL